MSAFIQISSSHKSFVKMNNQSEAGFELIILNEDFLNDVINDLNRLSKDGSIHIAWELKNARGYKVYKDVKLLEIKQNLNPFTHSYDGKVLVFSCADTESFSKIKPDIGKQVYKSTKRWKDYTLLERALKLSNLKFNSEEA